MRRVTGKQSSKPGSLRGPYTFRVDDKYYHGNDSFQFTCYPNGGSVENKGVWVKYFDGRTCTFVKPGEFCSSCRYVKNDGPGVRVYECNGHPIAGYQEPGDVEVADTGGASGSHHPMLEPPVPSVPSLFPPGWKERAEAVSSGEDAEVVDHELPDELLSDLEAEASRVGAVSGAPAGGSPGDDGSDGNYEPSDVGEAEKPIPDDGEDMRAILPEGVPAVGAPLILPKGSEEVPEGEVAKAVRRRKGGKKEPKNAVLDYWEPVPGRNAWVRHHVWARQAQFVPVKSKEGPDPETLDDVRITQYSFVDGTLDAKTDNWRGEEAHNLADQKWVGESWFFLKGHAPAEKPARRAVRLAGKRRPFLATPEPDVMRKLVSGEGVNREGLVGGFGNVAVERWKLAAAQRSDADFGGVMIAHMGWNENLSVEAIRRTLTAFKAESGSEPSDRNIDGILEYALEFELVAGVLYRKVYDVVDQEVQLRLCVPQQPHSKFEYPGRSAKPMGYRERVLLENHNGMLGGHVGRERTYELISKDYWWPGMYEGVRRWCRNCEQCQRERGSTGTTAYSRTQFYSRPFRCLQYDTVKCREEHEDGYKYILTCICCFSRFCWLIPLKTKSAESVADGLVTHVFLGIAMFPTVMRSDNAKEFVGEVAQEINRLLGISHITGSSYHPQSQGMVESMHKTLNAIMRCLIAGRPTAWETMLPYAQCILRIMPMKSLGGRSPYEVVLGFRPRLPSSLLGGLPVEDEDVETYATKLQKHFSEMYKELELKFKEHEEDTAGRGDGRLSAQLKLGDAVLLKREPSTRREGALRFQERVYPEIFRIVRGSHPTFWLKVVGNPGQKVPVREPVSADNLVKLDMPEIEIDPNQPRRLELKDDNGDPTEGWTAYSLERFAVDGNVCLRQVADPAKVEWVDLSTQRYRWLV